MFITNKVQALTGSIANLAKCAKNAKAPPNLPKGEEWPKQKKPSMEAFECV